MADEQPHHQAPTNPSVPEPSKDFMDSLDNIFVKKAPFQIPASGREWIVKYGPWINVILLVPLLMAALTVLGIGAAVLPLSGIAGVNATTGLTVAMIALVVQVGLMLAALPGLFARKKIGWLLVFYGDIFSFIYSVLRGEIFSALIGVVIGLYILFQIRSYYK